MTRRVLVLFIQHKGAAQWCSKRGKAKVTTASTTLIDLFTRHKVAANLLMIMMLLSGIWAVDRINTQLDPTVDWPIVFVRAAWQGASAEDVEQLIIVPIEQQLRTVNGVREVMSVSYSGLGRIRINFSHETDMMLAVDEVKQRIAQIRNFPVEMEPLIVSKGTDYEYVAAVLLTGQGSLPELFSMARDFERELLDRGIDQIRFDGLQDEEIAIQISGSGLLELDMTLDHVADEIARRSSNTPAGTVGRGQGSRQLRSLDQKQDVAGFEALEIALAPDGRLTRLGDISTISKRAKDGEAMLMRDGDPAIVLNLLRLSDTDAIESSRMLHDWLVETRVTLPQGVKLHVYQEASVLLTQQLTMIFKNGLSGLVLVVLTLFLFLNGRVGFWVMVGIPISFLFATVIYYGVFAGSINILALITFVMALGIVVDDAIVVGEDAVTQFEAGKSPAEAAAGGARRMFVPVVTSSLTTMAAFVPLLMTGGDLGQFIVTLPTVMLCVIIASLIECFLVLPGHLRRSFEKQKGKSPSAFRQSFDASFASFRENYYLPLLKRSLNNPGTTVCIAFGCVIVAFSLAVSGRVGVNFITGMDIETLEANVEFSADATEDQRQRFMQHLEASLMETNQHFESANINGFVTSYNLAELGQEEKYGTQYASLEIEYAWEEDRTVSPATFVTEWRERVVQLPIVEQLTIEVAGGANNGMPDISLVLRGNDIPTLKRAADDLGDALASYEGVSNIFDDLPYGKDQIVFSITPSGKSLGITTQSLGRQLRAAYNGRIVQIFNQDDVELEVTVMLPDAERENLSSLKRFPVQTPAGEWVALGLVAELSNRRGIDVINHNNGFLSVNVSASVDSEVNNTQRILAHLEKNALQEIKDRYGLTSDLSGASERNQQIVETMTVGAVLTLIFIYLILAWSFASYTWPLAVMTAIPLGLTGAIVGHWVMGVDIGAMSLLAFFSLTGIVVNDSIVLISFFRRNVESGMQSLEAINDAAVSRFRAVILTSLTTISGLTPLMFESLTLAMYMVPIAITICFGLAFATLLVLLVVPSLIIIIENVKKQVGLQPGKILVGAHS